MDRKNAVAFTGHRPQKFPWRYQEADPKCVALKAYQKVVTLQHTIFVIRPADIDDRIGLFQYGAVEGQTSDRRYPKRISPVIACPGYRNVPITQVIGTSVL